MAPGITDFECDKGAALQYHRNQENIDTEVAFAIHPSIHPSIMRGRILAPPVRYGADSNRAATRPRKLTVVSSHTLGRCGATGRLGRLVSTAICRELAEWTWQKRVSFDAIATHIFTLGIRKS
jgi:hypothetical protein